MSDEVNEDVESMVVSNSYIPLIRIYVAMVDSGNDLVPIDKLPEIMGDNPGDFLRELIDKGIYNIYGTDFIDTEKIL